MSLGGGFQERSGRVILGTSNTEQIEAPEMLQKIRTARREAKLKSVS
jgi:hypothetical protein